MGKMTRLKGTDGGSSSARAGTKRRACSRLGGSCGTTSLTEIVPVRRVEAVRETSGSSVSGGTDGEMNLQLRRRLGSRSSPHLDSSDRRSLLMKALELVRKWPRSGPAFVVATRLRTQPNAHRALGLRVKHRARALRCQIATGPFATHGPAALSPANDTATATSARQP